MKEAALAAEYQYGDRVEFGGLVAGTGIAPMTANPEERGVLTKVRVTYPDGRTVIRTLLFPSVFLGKRWMGINICECGDGIRYIWDENRSFQKAACSACGIVFAIEKP